jgi:hypothetical protein
LTGKRRADEPLVIGHRGASSPASRRWPSIRTIRVNGR